MVMNTAKYQELASWVWLSTQGMKSRTATLAGRGPMQDGMSGFGQSSGQSVGPTLGPANIDSSAAPPAANRFATPKIRKPAQIGAKLAANSNLPISSVSAGQTPPQNSPQANPSQSGTSPAVGSPMVVAGPGIGGASEANTSQNATPLPFQANLNSIAAPEADAAADSGKN
jgi:hypothetical protein